MEKINVSIKDGLNLTGSNYLQDHLEIFPHLEESDKIESHYIGKIQSTKITKIVENFDFIQTLSSLKHYRKITKQTISQKKVVPILIEINISKEDNKSGIYPEELDTFLFSLKEVLNSDYTPIHGFMTIGRFDLNAEDKRAEFKEFTILTSNAFIRFRDLFSAKELSFGMSEDYLTAVELGATIVRLGTVLFGTRIQ